MRSSAAKTTVQIVLTQGKLKEVRIDAPVASAERITELAIRIAQRLETSGTHPPGEKTAEQEIR